MITALYSAQDLDMMHEALRMAKIAMAQGEVPVGAVVVREGKIIGRGWNQSIQLSDPTAHAEIQAMRHAASALDNYRLTDCQVYCTLEPCVMCVGALVHARVKKLYYAATDPKAGALGGAWNVLEQGPFNHRFAVHQGILASPCGELLTNFFQERRSGL